MNASAMTGARLAYVVVPIPGNVEREVCEWVANPKGKGGKLIRKKVSQPAGFMAYFPRGHAIRFKNAEELAKYGLNQEPRVINLNGLIARGSPVAQLLASQDASQRDKGMTTLQENVIQLAIARSGPVLMPEQINNRALRFGKQAA